MCGDPIKCTSVWVCLVPVLVVLWYLRSVSDISRSALISTVCTNISTMTVCTTILFGAVCTKVFKIRVAQTFANVLATHI